MTNNSLLHAQFSLAHLRDEIGATNLDLELECIDRALADGHSLKSIGTTQDELDSLVVTWRLKRAKYSLASLREAKGWMPFHLDCIESAVKAGYSLETIGTTQEEVDALPKPYALQRAQECLESLRQTSGYLEYNTKTIDDAMALGCSLEDIGTSEKELGTFASTFALRNASNSLIALYRRLGPDPNAVKNMEREELDRFLAPVEHALSLGHQLSDIGISKKWYANLRLGRALE